MQFRRGIPLTNSKARGRFVTAIGHHFKPNCKQMNPILKQAFAEGIQRYYPYGSTRLIVSVYQSYVLYYVEDQPDSTELSLIQLRPDNLKAFEFEGTLIPLALSLPYYSK